LLLACNPSSKPVQTPAPTAHDAPTVPDFSLTSLAGDTVKLSDYRGKVVVVVFWAVSSAPGIEAVSRLAALRRRLDGAFELLPISVDGPETAVAVAHCARDRKFPEPVLLDTDSTIFHRYNPKGESPFISIIDRQQRITKQSPIYFIHTDDSEWDGIVRAIKDTLKPPATP